MSNCQQFVQTDEDNDWTCVCGHGYDEHGGSPSTPSAACQTCPEG